MKSIILNSENIKPHFLQFITQIAVNQVEKVRATL